MQPTGVTTETNVDAVRPVRVGAAKWIFFMLSRTPKALYAVSGVTLAALAALAAGLAFDLRWTIVGMMLLLLVLPMIAAILFFIYGLKDVNCLNLTYHRITKGPEGLVITIMALEKAAGEAPEDDGKEEGNEERDKDKNYNEESHWTMKRTVVIDSRRLAESIADNGGLWQKITDGDGDEQWLFIPDYSEYETDKR